MRVFIALALMMSSVSFAEEFKVIRKSEYGSSAYYPWEWAWTPEEQKLYNSLIVRKAEPYFDEYTKGMMISGGAWKIDTDKNGFNHYRWSMDWRLIKEPDGLTNRGREVFWSLTRKQIAKHWLDHRYFSKTDQKERQQATKDLIGLVDSNTIQRVSVEPEPEAVLPSGEKIDATHELVLKWLEDKPKMIPGVGEEIPMAVPVNQEKPPMGKIPRTYRE